MARWSLILSLCFVLFSSSIRAYIHGPLTLAWQWSPENFGVTQGHAVLSIDKKKIYYVSGPKIYALDVVTGNVIWQYPLQVSPNVVFQMTPYASGGTVYAVSNDNRTHAVDSETGIMRWIYPSLLPVIAPPFRIGEYIILTYGGTNPINNGFMSLYAETGQTDWRTPNRIFEGLQGSAAPGTGNIIGFTRKPTMFALDPIRRTQIWEVLIRQLLPNPHPVILGNNVYLMDGTYLACYNVSIGKRQWEVNLNPNVTESAVGDPVVSPTGIAVATNFGRVHVYDSNGKPLIKEPINIGFINGISMTWSGRYLMVFDGRQVLRVYDTGEDGNLVWSISLPQQTIAATPTSRKTPLPSGFVKTTVPPLTEDQRVFICSPDQGLLAFDSSGVDTIPPTIKMIYPYPGDEFSTQPPAEIVFRVEDIGTGVKPDSIRVLDDNILLKHIYAPDGTLRIPFGMPNANRPLKDGRHMIKVIAEDWVGNIADAAFNIVVVNALGKSRQSAGFVGGLENQPESESIGGLNAQPMEQPEPHTETEGQVTAK